MSVPKSLEFEPLQRVSEYFRLDLWFEQFAGLVAGGSFEGVEHGRVVEHHFVLGEREDAISKSGDGLAVLGIHGSQVLVKPTRFRLLLGGLGMVAGNKDQSTSLVK